MKYIAILGHGVVGTGCARMIEENRAQIARVLGEELSVRYILDVRDLPGSPWADRIVHDFDVILRDPEVAAVAEVIGGVHPASDFARAALLAGKHVVTSNKECVSVCGDELTRLAAERGVTYRFEASCGGGIPLISPICRDLRHNDVDSVEGILNGTTNYILTRMCRGGQTFEGALAEAQKRGYAERDPSADVEGWDARRKINILCACVTGALHDDAAIPCEGIGAIRAADVKAAAQAGYAVKLLGRMVDGYLLVAPHLVSFDCPLSHIDDVYNGALVHGNFVGDVMLYGRGAGAEPTASAVVADLVAALSRSETQTVFSRAEGLPDFGAFACRRYLSVPREEADRLTARVPGATPIPSPEGEWAVLTPAMTENEVWALGREIPLLAALRVRA